jgi:predicted MFS family arabinose efflux permease
MLQASLLLYKNAYSGLSRPMWWLALVMFINRSGTMVIPFLTVYLIHKGFTLEQAGYVMAAFGAGSFVGGFLGGILTDRLGHYPVQVGSLFLNGILFLVLQHMQSLTQIMGCIFVLSTLGDAFRPANSAAIALYSNEDNRTRCYALNRLAINLGWAIGPAIGGLLAAYSYSLLFWVDGGTCMIASLLLFRVFSPSRQGVKEDSKKPVVAGVSAYRDKIFLKGMFLLFLVGLCFFQIFSIMPVYFKTFVHLNEQTIGIVLALNGMLIVLVEMVLVYKLENRYDPVYYMALGAALIGLSFLMLLFDGLPAVIALILIITLGEMLLFPFLNNFWVKRSLDHNRGQYAALNTMSFSVAMVLAPNYAAQTATRFGFSILWIINFAICLIAAIGFLGLKKRRV